jgi:ProP effector
MCFVAGRMLLFWPEILAELYPNCFHQPRQPLKIGIHNDIIARHPELRPSLIASALKTYTRSLGYLETLKAGAARIDLEGKPVGTVTGADEEHAKRKVAKAARRAAGSDLVDYWCAIPLGGRSTHD